MTTHTDLRRLGLHGLVGLLGLLGWLTAAQAAPTSVTACGTISQSGTYVLQNNITTAGTCLTIDADFVTLNLNGFTLTGDGSGHGIVCNAGRQGLEVRNGTVRSFNNGIWAVQCDYSRISGVRAVGNTSDGIVASVFATGSAVISGCLALNNGSQGAVVAYGTIRGTVANNNNRGLWADNCPTLLLGNVATNNSTANIYYQNGSTGCVDVDNVAP